jgi:hypothetical protein
MSREFKMSIEKDLEVVLEKLRSTGWSQGAYEGEGGTHCIVGAMYAIGTAIDNFDSMLATFHAANELTNNFRCYDPNKVSIITWNDDTSRTFEDVELAFKKAIVYAGENNL